MTGHPSLKKNIEMSMISLGRKNPQHKPMSLFSTMTISTQMSTLRCTGGPGWLSKMWHWWSCVCWAARLCYYPAGFLETTPPDVLTVEGSHVHICFVWMHNAQYIHCCFCASASCCRAAPNFQIYFSVTFQDWSLVSSLYVSSRVIKDIWVSI